jgi:hypothetical protein
MKKELKKIIIELRSTVRSGGYEMQEIVPSLAGGEGVITSSQEPHPDRFLGLAESLLRGVNARHFKKSWIRACHVPTV